MTNEAVRDVQIRVTGHVQGVGFRAGAHHRARKLGVDLHAENQPDGSVLLEATGKADAVERLVVWAKRGPCGARVDQVVITDRDARAGGFA